MRKTFFFACTVAACVDLTLCLKLLYRSQWKGFSFFELACAGSNRVMSSSAAVKERELLYKLIIR